MPAFANGVKHTLKEKIVTNKYFFLYFLSSLALMHFAQPDLSLMACVASCVGGYAFFWKANSLLLSKKKRFYLSVFWFSLISFSHLNWFTADRYVGWYIYIFLTLFVTALGVCFGCLCLLIPKPDEVTFPKALQIAALWTIFEWGRLFLLSGFSWDPIGLMMTANIYSLQLVSVLGLFGLTFWILLTNMLAYRILAPTAKKYYGIFLTIALFPYVFGCVSVAYHKKKQLLEKSSLSVLLVQTCLYPEEKKAYKGIEKKMVPLLEQWERIFHLVKKHDDKKVDLIVFSEATVPYGTFLPIYTQQEAAELFQQIFSKKPLVIPDEFVGNAYFAQNLSKFFNADLVIGFEDGKIEKVGSKKTFEVYNAAFLFHPDSKKPERYEKRVLVPMGEYIPFAFCKKFLSRFGITDSFTPGKEAKVFLSKKLPLGLSICYEETYGHLMRQNRQKGAQLLVNLTNDVWYPHSRLPIVHFYHGRVRAVESGIPLVRASNTGVTCAVDSLGRIVDMLPYEKKNIDCPSDSLCVNVPTYSYTTLYTHLGDTAIISISFFIVILSLRRRKRTCNEKIKS